MRVRGRGMRIVASLALGLVASGHGGGTPGAPALGTPFSDPRAECSSVPPPSHDATPSVRSITGVREVRLIMGTTAEVQVAGLTDPRPALDAAFAAVQRVDDLLSLWKPSELTRLNDAGGGSASAETLAVLRAALAISRASGGAFDPTVEPLVRASGGLGGAHRTLGVAERKALLPLVGFQHVTLDVVAASVRLAQGARLDLGGIAKGYAADRAVAELRSLSARSGWVDLGTSSLGAFGEALPVDIRDPDQPDGPPLASFALRDAFVGTSATEQKGAHILDPRTGEPAGRNVVCATVVARTGMEADALSTALYVLGADAGLALVERRGAWGLLVERSAHDRRTARSSSGFAERHGLVVAPGIERR